MKRHYKQHPLVARCGLEMPYIVRCDVSTCGTWHGTLTAGTRHVLWRDVHYHVAHSKKSFRWQRFREEICQIVGRSHVRYFNVAQFDELTDVEMASLDVFNPGVVLRVV